jgi:hypothetical protein
METFYPGYEAGAGISAKAVFVDLDKTFLDGTVISMTDEELSNAELIESTIALIRQAKNSGIPVIMVTRNSARLIDRLFAIRPELRSYFDEIIPCPTGRKSEPIKKYLEEKRISPKRAIFLDDTCGERYDVAMNVQGVTALHPDSACGINIKPPDIYTEMEKKRQRIEKLLVLHDPIRRRMIANRLKPLFLADTDYIDLAA